MIGINVARWEKKVRALIQAKGDNPIDSASEALVFTAVVENDRPEWGWIGNEFRWATHANLGAGGVGNSTSLALNVPAAAGVIAIVEGIRALAPWNLTFTLDSGMSTFIAGPAAFPRDFRQLTQAGAAQQAAAKIFTRITAPAFGGGEMYRMQAGNVEGGVLPIMVTPGTALVVQTVTANAANEISIVWREVPLEGGKT